MIQSGQKKNFIVKFETFTEILENYFLLIVERNIFFHPFHKSVLYSKVSLKSTWSGDFFKKLFKNEEAITKI